MERKLSGLARVSVGTAIAFSNKVLPKNKWKPHRRVQISPYKSRSRNIISLFVLKSYERASIDGALGKRLFFTDRDPCKYFGGALK